MERYYHFWADAPIRGTEFAEILQDSYRHPIDWVVISSNEAYCKAPADLADILEPMLPLLASDVGSTLTVLVSHANDALAHAALKKAVASHHEKVTFIGDLLLDDLMIGDLALLTLAVRPFQKIPHAALVTAQTFLACGLNATAASKKLYVHRNTFNYRLNQFIRMTGLDIRDYHNAEFFRLVSRMMVDH